MAGRKEMRITNLSQYKEKKGLSGKELAQLLEISESYLSEILSGQRTISKKLALKIFVKTGIPILNLLYPQDEARP